MLGFSLRINISRVEVVDSRSLDLRGGIHEYRHSVAEKKKKEKISQFPLLSLSLPNYASYIVAL